MHKKLFLNPQNNFKTQLSGKSVAWLGAAKDYVCSRLKART